MDLIGLLPSRPQHISTHAIVRLTCAQVFVFKSWLLHNNPILHFGNPQKFSKDPLERQGLMFYQMIHEQSSFFFFFFPSLFIPVAPHEYNKDELYQAAALSKSLLSCRSVHSAYCKFCYKWLPTDGLSHRLP